MANEYFYGPGTLQNVMPNALKPNQSINMDTTTPQPFYGLFSGTTRVSQRQKRTSGLYGARED